MSTPEPVAYQAEAIEKISKALTTLLSVDQSEDRLIVFKSPTGSGKTLMVASALADAFAKPSERKFIVLWLSPSDGNLHRQSAKALDGLLDGAPMQVRLLESRDDIVRYQDPAPGTVFVAGWNKLRAEKDGEFTNVMVRNGETASFFNLLARASAKGLDLITVIDESHRNLGAEKTENLMKAIREMRPFIQLELSATPTASPDLDKMNDEIHHWIRVKFKDVEAAGMVRRAALLNDRFAATQATHPKDSLSVQVLWAAWEKTQALTAFYAAAGSPVKPLLLIQYPDGDEAVARAALVEDFLAKRGLVKGSTYAIWLSGEHSDDLEKIASYDSPYQALIFKQAIATGWDCPRAQVLVQFRDPKSPTFQIQTLGRLMRSPEQKHYENEELNLAYVFSDLEGASVRVESDDPEAPVRDQTVVRSNAYPADGLALHSAFQPRNREFHYPMVENLEPALKAALDAAVPALLPPDPYTFTPVTIPTDARIAARELDAGIERELTGGEATGHLDDLIVQALYDLLLVASIGQYRSRAQSLSRIKRIITLWFKVNRPSWTPDEIQHFALRHQPELIAAIDKACNASMAAEMADAIAAARGKRRTRDDWEVPQTDLVASKDHDPAPAGHLCTPPLVWKGRSKPEQRFEQYLAEQFELGLVTWWWKNDESDEKYLGVEYFRPVDTTLPEGANQPDTIEEDRITYPDYLVMTAAGVVWAIEVKDVGDIYGAPGGVTHAKAKGLAAWVTLMATSRNKHDKLLPRAAVRAGVVVPVELSPGIVTPKIGDPSNWLQPNDTNLAAGTGWADLDLSS